jgi:uncharacterized protein YprB with RNaseH-like and TPR domain
VYSVVSGLPFVDYMPLFVRYCEQSAKVQMTPSALCVINNTDKNGFAFVMSRIDYCLPEGVLVVAGNPNKFSAALGVDERSVQGFCLVAAGYKHDVLVFLDSESRGFDYAGQVIIILVALGFSGANET